MVQPAESFAVSRFSRPRLLQLAAQVSLALLAVVLARVLTEWLWITPVFRKQSPMSIADLQTVFIFFFFVHTVVLGILLLIERTPPFANLRRFFVELLAALAATSIASSSVFLLTVVPFSANFFSWIYVLVVIFYFALLAASTFSWPSAGTARADLSRTSFFSSLGLLRSPWVYVTILAILLPGILAFYYKADRDFANTVNRTRATLAADTRGSFSLVSMYPDQELERPMYARFEPGAPDNLITLSRTGRLARHVTAPTWETEVLIDLTDEVNLAGVPAGTYTEMGAYSFVFHPEFASDSLNSGFLYVFFTSESPEGQFNRLVRFDVSLSTQEKREASRLEIMDLDRGPNSRIHVGGDMFFDADGFLYISTGDNNMREHTQRIDRHFIGGILRIDVDMRGGDVSTPIKRQPEGGVTQHYFVPVDNPWYGEPDVLEEYWALGFRNPWRMSMDPMTGSIWLGDVGADAFEEQNRVEKGDNAGWDYWEGETRKAPTERGPIVGRLIMPIHHYRQTALRRAAMGGFVYRGTKYPNLQGLYLFADNMAGTIHALDPEAPAESVRLVAQSGYFGETGISSMFADEAGDVYVTVLGSMDEATGKLLRLERSEMLIADESKPVVAAATAESVLAKYEAVCSRCHGLDGHGAPELDLGVQRPNFTSAEWQNRVTDDYLRRVIVEGGEAVGINVMMPGVGDFFSEEELDLLIAKLRAFGETNGMQPPS